MGHNGNIPYEDNVMETLKTLRLKAKLSQADLAKELRIKPRTISKWEHYEGIPSLDEALILCKVLNCSMRDLCSAFGLQIHGIVMK